MQHRVSSLVRLPSEATACSVVNAPEDVFQTELYSLQSTSEKCNRVRVHTLPSYRVSAWVQHLSIEFAM